MTVAGFTGGDRMVEARPGIVEARIAAAAIEMRMGEVFGHDMAKFA